MPEHWQPQSLYLRVLLAMIAGITIVLAAVTGLNLRDSRSRLVQELQNDGLNQINIISHGTSVYLAQRDEQQLREIGRAATEGGRIQFIAFYSPSNDLLITIAAPSAPDQARISFDSLPLQAQTNGNNVVRWSNDYLEIADPIDYQGQRVGVLVLRLGTAGLEDDLNRELIRSIITALSLAIVLSLTVGLLLRQFVIVPLRRLSDASEQIRAGAWVMPPGQNRSDELGLLARSFGQMVSAVRARETQLQEQVTATQALNTELDARVIERTRELHDLVATQDQLLDQLRQMSTPVVPVMRGVIVLPIVGSLDSQRAAQLIQSVLAGIEEHHAHLAVLDITGVPIVDTHVASVIMQSAGAARLLGARAVLVGIRPEVAQTLVQIGVDLSGIQTSATLQEALRMTTARVKHVA